jgi:hypothetical protein
VQHHARNNLRPHGTHTLEQSGDDRCVGLSIGCDNRASGDMPRGFPARSIYSRNGDCGDHTALVRPVAHCVHSDVHVENSRVIDA